MLAVLIIGILAIGLPVALWLIARHRESVPYKAQVSGEVNKWLLSEYGLGSRDRSLVQEAVLGRYATVTVQDQSPRRPTPKAPATLRPELLEAARGLATRVAADGFRTLRVARRIGYVQLATGAVFAVYGIGVLATGWGSNPFFGVFTLLEAAIIFVPVGAYTALIIPRRRHRSAQNYLATVADSPVAPPTPPG